MMGCGGGEEEKNASPCSFFLLRIDNHLILLSFLHCNYYHMEVVVESVGLNGRL